MAQRTYAYSEDATEVFIALGLDNARVETGADIAMPAAIVVKNLPRDVPRIARQLLQLPQL